MKFSINLADSYSNLDIKSIPHNDIVERLGAQLGSIEEVIDWAPKYYGVVIVRVVSCEKHPNADKLSVCLVDDGGIVQNIDRDDDGFVQVVCGAKNARAEMFAAWIPPGSTVPNTYHNKHEPVIMESRELRGKVSNGMLASPKELDISDEHEGILDIKPEDTKHQPVPGEAMMDFFGLDDFVVDCENKMFTHRPDCFGNLGIARELAGIFGHKFISPEWYTNQPVFEEKNDLEISISNEIPELVPRFSVVSMHNLVNSQSPIWLQTVLNRVGIKPISRIVDITNYVMHLTGQPLHAFDFDKLAKYSNKPSLMARMSKEKEKITLLGGKEVILTKNDIVIATDKQPIAIAGVMGGTDTEVDLNTTKIIIECANFDMYSIRRTSMRHGLFTDAVTRFNKGQSPLQNDRVLRFAMTMMQELTGGQQIGKVYDLHNFDLTADNLNHLRVSAKFINDRLGSDIAPHRISELLTNVEFTVKPVNTSTGAQFDITVPFWRMDIAIKEDIVEEVGRLYGYSNLPISLPIRTSKPTQTNPRRIFKQKIRNILTSAGANEVLTYSFVHGNLLKKVGVDPDKFAYHLRNAISPDLQYYRTSVTPSLLSKIHNNIKLYAGSEDNEFAIFELGKAHIKGINEADSPDLPKQFRKLAFVFAADQKTAKKYQGSAFYQAKIYLDLITDNQAEYAPLVDQKDSAVQIFQRERSAVVSIEGVEIGYIGEYATNVRKSLKLPDFASGFEVDTDLLQTLLCPTEYRPLSIYPSSQQDITLEVKNSVNWSSLYKLIRAELVVKMVEDNYQFSINPLDIYQPEGTKKKRITFRVQISSYKKTMRTEEFSTIVEHIAKELSEKFEAIRT